MHGSPMKFFSLKSHEPLLCRETRLAGIRISFGTVLVHFFSCGLKLFAVRSGYRIFHSTTGQKKLQEKEKELANGGV
jgi:hypothetical protein